MAPAFVHLHFAYGSLLVLEDVSLAFPEKGMVCLSGPSGCGKTTMLRLLAGLEQPRSGRIEGVAGMTTAAVFRDRLLPWMTALDNVAVVLPGDWKRNRERAEQALSEVGLAENLLAYPADLSGGMKRRVAIARALRRPGRPVAGSNEPFTGIDPALRDRIAALLRQQAEQALLVLVTHIEEEARLLGARILPLSPPLRGDLSFP